METGDGASALIHPEVAGCELKECARLTALIKHHLCPLVFAGLLEELMVFHLQETFFMDGIFVILLLVAVAFKR